MRFFTVRFFPMCFFPVLFFPVTLKRTYNDVERLSAKNAARKSRPTVAYNVIQWYFSTQACFSQRLSDMTMFVQSAPQNKLFYFSNLI